MFYFFCGMSIVCSLLGILTDNRKLVNAGIVLTAAAPMLGLATDSIIKMIIP